MSNKKIKLERLFNRGQNCVIISMDHGYINGPTDGMINMRDTIAMVSPDVDAVLLSAGILQNVPEGFNYKGAPMAVTRINWSPLFYGAWGGGKPYNAQGYSVKDAVRIGADIILVCLTLNTGDSVLDAANVGLFGKICGEAREMDVPILGEYIPVDFEELPPDALADQVYRGCRIVAELGADAVKSVYTNNFKEVTNACPIPILGLGGSKTSDLESLKQAESIIAEGGKGVVYGRNVLQNKNPLGFQTALISVVKKRVKAEEAIKSLI